MKIPIFLLVLSICLFGCQSAKSTITDNDFENWTYGDLRLLDPIDATEPDQDLIALYSRVINQAFQIRIDFLDLNINSRQVIYLALDTKPGGSDQINANNNTIYAVNIPWDYLIIIRDSGLVSIVDNQYTPNYGSGLIVVRDYIQDNIVIQVDKRAIPIFGGLTKLQVIITPPNQEIISDLSDPISIDSPSPSRAKVVFAFWNTFSAITPAQTLRSWAGAHSGPMSNRHGLKYLLDPAATTNSTVFLLDLLNQDTLSALDYINVLQRIREYENKEIVALPMVTDAIELKEPGAINNFIIKGFPQNLDFQKIWNIANNVTNKNTNRDFVFILLLNNLLYLNYKSFDIGGNDYAQLKYVENNCPLLPYYLNKVSHLSAVPLECKRILLTYALSKTLYPIVLGGDFSNSIMGDPAMSSEVFIYINNHPWIQVQSIDDLATLSDVKSHTSPTLSNSVSTTFFGQMEENSSVHESMSPIQSDIYSALAHSPKNQLTDLAWQVYYFLIQPASADLLSLRTNYLGQIGQILAAADWASDPYVLESCNSDLDYDSKNECILANRTIFLIIEPEGGYIPFAFYINSHGIHQIIGPTWEFIVGLSDHSLWDLSTGIRADPEQILGALADTFSNWKEYQYKINDQGLVLYSDIMPMRKIYNISENSIHFDIQNNDPLLISPFIPLVVDPWIRFTQGWGDKYISSVFSPCINWGIISVEMVDVCSPNQLSNFPFNYTRAMLAFPEDPNFEYSRGHYLPYPMSLVEVNSAGNILIDININP